ncbi:MAG: hypothetical protein D6795_01775 [Deltaproteobacteria bacterium]|nr:MAG: hypothetical protein D6795_01775 [Deltaproteobacteria bacterium]
MSARFIVYGLLGWCIEIVFTALGDRVTGKVQDLRLEGHTYLWMFPIYGGGGICLEGMRGMMGEILWPFRGLLYTAAIFAVEYATGWLLRRLIGRCPWDYGGVRWNVHGLIRIDYAPFWFLAGLAFERVHDFLLLLTRP